jgi:serine/threonine-protein kinase
VIDEATNVYTLGAMIFHFFGSYSEEEISQIYQNNRFFPCAKERWELSKDMYEVSLKAVMEDRSERYQSVSEFFINWNKVLTS